VKAADTSPRGTNPIDATQTFKRRREEAVEIRMPEQMATLLAAADETFLAVLAIGAYAGLRTSEILALDWRDVRLRERVIKVVHGKTRRAPTREKPPTFRNSCPAPPDIDNPRNRTLTASQVLRFSTAARRSSLR
jgi:integrase